MRTFTKGQFRFVLLTYCALILVGTFQAISHRTALTPTEVAEKASFGLPGLSDYQFAVFMICFLSAVLMAWLIGLISLFLLWRPGVYIFLAGVSTIWVVAYLRHRFIAGGFYGGVEMGLEVVIVTFALFGPAKHLFQRQGSEWI